MQVVIAEHRYRMLAEFADEAQGRQGARSTVDQIARQPQPVGTGTEIQLIEKSPELVVTALDVADRVDGHGYDRRPALNAAIRESPA